MEEIRGKSVLIVGYGREGKSVEQFLKTHYPKVAISIADQRDIPGIKVIRIPGMSFDGYDTVVRSPGVPRRLLTNARWVTSATNMFFSKCSGATIGVTGTKGKSTTASLIAHILKQKIPGIGGALIPGISKDVRLVGNIGRPVLDHLDGATKDTVFVVELSSHQLEDVRYSPHVAVLLPIVPEHLDYYDSFSAYEKAKSNIIRFQKKDDVVFYHPSVKKIAMMSRGKKISIAPSSYQSPLLGNQTNISAAVSVAKYFGILENTIQKSLKTFTSLPHRLEYVGEFKHVRFYNDSLATIPEATIHALEALQNVDTLIAGGFDRGLSYEKLTKYFHEHPIQTIILFPDTGEKIGKNVSAKKLFVRTMKEAVELAYQHTRPGKICLLSPASASFNLFKNYEDRGNQFKEWVKKIGKNS